MRLVLALLLGGCLAGTLDANSRPTVIPKLSELPEDHAQRDAILDQSQQAAGPEQRRGMTKKERRAETAAALAAAIIGDMFSSTHSVTIGVAIQPEADHTPLRRQEEEGQGSASAAPLVEPPAEDLMPWVKLK